jgi:hypothetical protein
MDSSSIELPGSEIESVTLEDEVLTIRFSRALIVKTMTGSVERTLWWQKGALILGGAEVEGEMPPGPLVAAGGDVVENVYTYRDMIPIPLQSRGRARCDLRFRGREGHLRAQGESIRLEMEATPKYIRHIRPDREA